MRQSEPNPTACGNRVQGPDVSRIRERRRSGVVRKAGLFTPPAVLLLLTAACGPLATDSEGIRYRSGGDLVHAAPLVGIDDTLPGDAMAAGRLVRFRGAIGGSFLGLGAAQEISGDVGRSVRGAGGSISVNGNVGHNVTLIGGEILFETDAEALGNVYLAGGRVEQRGRVGGHLRVAARDVVLDGPVAGDVDVVAATLTLGPFARIEGELTYRVPDEGVSVDPAARVQGDVMAVSVSPPSRLPGLAFRMMRVLGFLLVGAVALLLFPVIGKAAASLDTAPLSGLGLGLLWIVATPVLVGAAFVSVVGIPLAVIAGTLFIVALYVAPVVPGLWLGRRLLDRPGAPPASRVRAFLLGGALLAVGMFLSWVGWFIRMLATVAGFGGSALAIRARLERPEEAPSGV